ncbi:hypothetical protein [Actinopolymorpha alba]|uniref:hypothetical protein n=1 Tax=Actinopolymorpha alba TaxID=533267 RepID=UPI0012F67EAA|nr:hypothetical protein [Actinopolymorpha alba]
MRVLRVVAGALVALVGLVALVAGGVTAFWIVGPDDVVSASPRKLESKGVAVTTPPDLLDYYGNRLVVTVESAEKGRDVFVGVGHDIDVKSYFTNAPHTEITKVTYPLALTTREVDGKLTRVLRPTDIDWWVAKASGSGAHTLSWQLADGPYDLVIMSADGRAGVDVTATFGLELKGAFRTALLVFAGGALLLVGGILLIRGRRRASRNDAEVLWEGRDLWDQNEFWSQSGQPDRAPAPHRVPGDGAGVAGPHAGGPQPGAWGPPPGGFPAPQPGPGPGQPPGPGPGQPGPAPGQPVPAPGQLVPGAGQPQVSPWGPPAGNAPPPGYPSHPHAGVGAYQPPQPPPGLPSVDRANPPAGNGQLPPRGDQPRFDAPRSFDPPGALPWRPAGGRPSHAPRPDGPRPPHDPGRYPSEPGPQEGELPAFDFPADLPDLALPPVQPPAQPPAVEGSGSGGRRIARPADHLAFEEFSPGAEARPGATPTGEHRAAPAETSVGDGASWTTEVNGNGQGVALGAEYAEPPPWLPGPVGPVLPATTEGKDGEDRRA